MAAPNAYLSDVSCTSATWCMAVGYSAGPVATAQVWNGASWVPTDTSAAGPNSQINGVSCVSSASCMAVGLSQPAPGAYVEVLEQWNGTSWELMPPPAGPASPFLSGISCTSSQSCTAVGTQNGEASLIQEWDGTRWSLVPVSDPSGTGLGAVSCSTVGTCVAVGEVIVGQPLGTSGYPIIEASGPLSAGDAQFYGSMGGQPLNAADRGDGRDALTGRATGRSRPTVDSSPSPRRA